MVILLALLAPALDKAIESAQRARCAANLHAFGAAIPQYALDHRRKLMTPVFAWGASPYPNLARNYDSQGPGQWSAESIGPYIGGVDLINRRYGPQWYCPSSGMNPSKEAFNQRAAAGSGSDVLGRDSVVSYFFPDYAYFARVDGRNATYPEQLVGNSLGARGILMADTLFYWHGGGPDTWTFNHHAEGSSAYTVGFGQPVKSRQEIRGISGTNQLFGDAAVFWKRGEDFQPDKIWQPSTEVGWVGAAGPNPASDLNFY